VASRPPRLLPATFLAACLALTTIAPSGAAVLAAGGAAGELATSGTLTAAPPSGSSAPVSPGPSGQPGSGEGQPSATEVAAALSVAAAARAEAVRQSGRLSSQRDTLAAAASTAGLALERYQAAVLSLTRATLGAQAAQDRLQGSAKDVQDAQGRLGAWVRQAYGTGDLVNRSPALATLLSDGGLEDFDVTLKILQRMGASARRDLAALEQAQTEQAVAADRAQGAQRVAQDAAVAAATARSEADEAVALQRAAVEALQQQVAGARETAQAADRRATLLAQARAVADARARAWADQPGGPVGDCTGGDLSGYANGTIPLGALCPLWGAPRVFLRADAAYAFGRLSQAYAAVFGAPLCVTDGYRSYPDQVRVYAERPQLAAVPGTSNHGWGTAADLCGGVQSFGSTAHTWMLLNAPMYGWFHPSWAEPSGSRPEPWHWEFAG
jgi:hypothetical protein